MEHKDEEDEVGEREKELYEETGALRESRVLLGQVEETVNNMK